MDFFSPLSGKRDVIAVEISGINSQVFTLKEETIPSPLKKNVPGAEEKTRAGDVQAADIVNISEEGRQKNKLQARQSMEPLGAQDAISKSIESFLKTQNWGLNFSVHKETGQVVTQIVDNETKKVLKKIPPEEMLNLAVKMRELREELVREEEKQES
ncbi:MAG: flagellar protein FlaG [Thermodesulfobacteriota bacterium]